MKSLMIALLFLFPVFAMADEQASCESKTDSEQVTGQLEINTDVPKWLKGATITVRTADGRESTVPAEKFKVVPRKQQYLTTKTLQQQTLTCTSKAHVRRHRLAAFAGHGAQGGLNVDRSKAPFETSVESKVGIVGTGQYQYLLPVLDDRFSLGLQIQTNETVSAGIGFEVF